MAGNDHACITSVNADGSCQVDYRDGVTSDERFEANDVRALGSAAAILYGCVQSCAALGWSVATATGDAQGVCSGRPSSLVTSDATCSTTTQTWVDATSTCAAIAALHEGRADDWFTARGLPCKRER